MMKFMLMLMLMNFMMMKNKMMMFYYNLLYLMSFMMIFMFMCKVENLWFNFSLSIMCSRYSFMLIILSVWIMALILMCLNYLNKMKMVIFNMMLMLLMMFFLTVDLMMFYLLFEISLIPIFFLVIYWGSNIERVSAAYYLLIYMLLISFPLLMYIFDMNDWMMSFKFSIMVKFMETYMISVWGFLIIFLPFCIKMPMFMFHIWLPKAHVEAPVYGSMILAGVLLKMGSYGLIRLMELFLKVGMKYSYMLFSVGIVGSVMVSLVSLVQIDMKSLVAYSSVVHMNLMLCNLMTLFKLGMLSSYIMMISHGLCSSMMFYMVNLFYMHSSSRLMLLNKGLLNNLPMLSKWWFMVCIINFSFPLSISFISEVLSLMLIFNWDLMMMGFLMMMCFLSGAYSLYLFSYIYHGSNNYLQMKNYYCKVKIYMILLMHMYPLISFLLNMNIYMN